MDPLQFSVQNIVDGQAVSIALTGMGIVFCVLALISLFIAVLPQLMVVIGRYVPEEDAHPQTGSNVQTDDAGVAAIAYVFHTRRQQK